MTTLLDIAKTLDTKQKLVRVFGRRSNIGTSEHDVSAASEASGGSSAIVLPSSAGVVSVVSDSAQDAVSGTGLRSVRIVGLDADWNEKEIVVPTNGTTPSPSTATLIRINDARAEEVGSGGVNAGTMLLSIGGQVQAAILPGVGRAQQARYSVPRNRTAYLLRVVARSGGSSVATVRFYQKLGQAASAPKAVREEYQGAGLNVVDELKALVALPAQSDLWVRALTASSTAWVSAGFEILLVNTGE